MTCVAVDRFLFPVLAGLLLLPGVAVQAGDTAQTCEAEAPASRQGTEEVAGSTSAWSPLEARFFYSENVDGVSRIMVRDGTDGGHRTLTPGAAGGNYPVLSPDGQRIAFQRRDEDGYMDVWLMNLDGGDLRRLTRDPAHDYLPSFRPGEDAVYFVSWRREAGESEDANHHYVQAPVGGPAQRFLEHSPGTSAGIAWSPDGRTMILTRKSGEGAADLYLADVQGNVIRRLTDDARYNGAPSFSPDGVHIAFYSHAGASSRLEVLDLGSGRRTIIVADGRNWYPNWSPNGCWLLFTRSATADDSDTDLYVVRSQSGAAPRPLLTGPGRQQEGRWR